MILKLKNKKEAVNVLDTSTATSIQVQCGSAVEMEALREALTKDALSEFQYLTNDGEVIGRYQHYVLEDTIYNVEDGVYHVSFAIRQITDTEVRLDALENGQEIQNGAIDELAGIVGGDE